MLLIDAVADYLATRAGEGRAANTLRNDRSYMGKLLAYAGSDALVADLNDRAMDDLLTEASDALAPSSMNTFLNHLRPFFALAVRRGWLETSPISHRSQWKVMQSEKTRIPPSRFHELLNSADHPRDRMALALGLYLYLRSSEISSLNVGDVNLEEHEVNVTIHKTGQRDIMPLSIELAFEMYAWLDVYSTMLGRPLRADDPLVPAKHFPTFAGRGLVLAGHAQLKEGVRASTLGDVMKKTLLCMGYGEKKGEAMHILRRSGARARFDTLVGQGYDGAIREVQAMLHHESVTTTETYLGLTLDIQKRNTAIKGQRLFDIPMKPSPTDNVIPLRRA